jgi:hypothetical protein
VAVEGVYLPSFRWLDYTDKGFDALVDAAMAAYDAKEGKGTSAQRRLDRRITARYLLAALAAQGPYGDAVGIPRDYRSAKIKLPDGLTKLKEVPESCGETLDMLIAEGWVCHPIGANPTSSHPNFKSGKGKIAFVKLKSGENAGQPGGYCLSLKSWELLQAKGFKVSNCLPNMDRVIAAQHRVEGDKAKGTKRIKTRVELLRHRELKKWQRQIIDHAKIMNGLRFALRHQEQPDEELPSPNFYLDRVFNDAKYQHGGRFYSIAGEMKKENRPNITIEGLPLESLDYKSLHPRLGFALVGVDCSEGDIYQLEGHKREHVKSVITAAINAKSPSGYVYSVAKEILPEGGNAHDILKAFKAQYPAIQKIISSGLWPWMQRAEARAVEVFLEGFIAEGRPLFPVHDGYHFLAQDRVLFERLRPKAEDAIYAELFRVKEIIKTYPNRQRLRLPMD